MANPTQSLGVFRIVGRAFAAAFRNLPVLVVLALITAVPEGLLWSASVSTLQGLVSSWFPAHGILLDPQQAQIVPLVLADLPVMPWRFVATALVAPAAIHVFLRDRDARAGGSTPTSAGRATLADALNFGLSRWRRLIGPVTIAGLVIWIGSIVIIPAILYTLFWAFLEPVAALDDKVKQVLRRSTRLTRGRRGRIFRTYLLFLPWWGWYAVIGAFVLEGASWWVRLGVMVADEFVGIVILLSLLQLYLERMEQLEEARRLKEAAGTPA
ncbi:MAG: hypothetical protein JXB39_01850 [Deltaproteobacteria bacterium]|nr:hypothetical protein [Deltaproteobacteria bacterium]